MGNHGKMAGYWKIFIGIQSQLFLPEFIYLIVSLWKELLPSSKKQYTKSEIAKMSVISFKKTSIFPYIFCPFDTVELQKMYGKNQGFLKTDHGLLFMSVECQQSTTTVYYCTFYSGCQLSWRLTSITSILLLRQQITDGSWRVAGVWEGVFVLIHPRRHRGGQSGQEHPRKPRGSRSGWVKRRDNCFQAWAEELFRPCLKTFVAPFLPAWLTAPGSPRMENFRRPFSPGLTDCPWVFEDGKRSSRLYSRPDWLPLGFRGCRSTGLMSGKKHWLVKLTFYMFLRNSALREINKYSVNIQIINIYIYKKLIPCVKHTSFLSL